MPRTALQTWLSALRRRRVSVLIETLLALLVLWSVVKVALFFNNTGFLPQPYFFDSNDTFMDWFNVTVFAHNPGAYTQYDSVYPPLSFVTTGLFSTPSCYKYDAMYARSCDHVFAWAFLAFFVINTILTFEAFKRRDASIALPRTLAISLGLPMLFGYERGQLAIIAFTFFVIAHGGAIRSKALRWFSNAMTINYKPYLILTMLPYLAKRQWRALEICAISGIAIYALSYGIVGDGTPIEIIRNIQGFDQLPTITKFGNMFYQTSYKGVLDGLRSSFPFTTYLGSTPIELSLAIVPAIIAVGQLLSAACLIGAAWRPNAVPMHRLMALAISIPLTSSLVGGYASIFLLFLVFMERWNGPTLTLAIVTAYLLSLSVELQLVPIARNTELSYLSGRLVDFEIGVNLGELVRPGLVLLIQFLLITASFQEFWRARHKHPLLGAASTQTEPASA